MCCRCTKTRAKAMWAVLECLFFSGLLSGWYLVIPEMKSQDFFGSNCANKSEHRSLNAQSQDKTSHYVINDTGSDVDDVTDGILAGSQAAMLDFCVPPFYAGDPVTSGGNLSSDINGSSASALRLVSVISPKPAAEQALSRSQF